MSTMRSLAALTPEADASTEPALRAVQGLNCMELIAVREFFSEGQRCLAKLSGHSLENLRMLTVGTKSIARTQSSMISFPLNSLGDKVSNQKSQNFYELFEEYDENQDGALSVEEFKRAFVSIAGSDFTDESLDKLVTAADISGDGLIDIHEFFVWLYQTPGGHAPAHGDGALDESGKNNHAANTEALLAKIEALQAELRTKTKAINHLEESHEEEMEATHDFWREVAKNAVLTIDTKIDLEHATWLGNGKYGFVLKAKRRADEREVVVKMMGIRWAHLAVHEWQQGSRVGQHPHIVEYEEVMLHADDDSSVLRLLQAGYESGKLSGSAKRKKFPDRYICLTVELMNRGTVQDWMDKDMLMPSGLFCVMRAVAAALAYMHEQGITHNDIKPANVMLHEPHKGKMIIKLGDLGLAVKSNDQTADYWQYGMTAFCMLTGEKFGTHKYTAAAIDTFVEQCRNSIEEAGAQGRVAETLVEIPDILDGVFKRKIEMKSVQNHRKLSSWVFFENVDTPEGAESETHDDDSSKTRRINTTNLEQVHHMALSRATISVGGHVGGGNSILRRLSKLAEE